MGARLRAVPAIPRRGIGIIRVSKEGGRGDRLVSTQIQRDAVIDHGARNGIDIIDWIEAVDESGSQPTSPWWRKLDAAIDRVEDGDIDVVVGWEFSRAARNRYRWAVALDRVEAAGGSIESATEPVDTTRASGRLQRGVLAEFHAYKAEAIGEGWQDVQRLRRERGLPHHGRPMLGYVYDTEKRVHVPDPNTRNLVDDLHRRYVDGDGLATLERWARTAELVNPRTGAAYSWRGIASVLDSGFAAGLLRVHNPDCPRRHKAREVCPDYVHLAGAHEPIVDPALWAQVAAARAARATTPPRLLAATTPLSGVGRCGTCGRRLSVQRKRGRNANTTRLQCTNRDCPRQAGCVYEVAERELQAWLPTVAGQVERHAQRSAVPDTDRQVESERATQRAARAQQALDQLTLDLADRVITREEFERAAARKRADLSAALADVERLGKADQVDRRHVASAERLLRARGTLPPAVEAAVLRDLCAIWATRRDGQRGCDVRVYGAWEDQPAPTHPAGK